MTGDREDRSDRSIKISRREALRWGTALAAGAAFSPTAASAGLDGQVVPPGSSSSGTQLLDTREGALRSNRQLLEACTARGSTLPADIPSRSPQEAVDSCTARRLAEERKGLRPLSPLHQLLAGSWLSESRLGLSHWQILDEAEDPGLGHFRFPISPYTLSVDDGRQGYLLLGNWTLIGDFRGREYLEDNQRRMFDRAVWAMNNGCQGTAVIEFDRPLSPQKVSRTIRALYQYGIRTITWGNELNDPSAPWRDNLSELVKIFTAAAETKREHNLQDLDLSLPGLAYYGNGEYLQKLLRTFGALLPRRVPGQSAMLLPFQRVVDHYYGPVEGFLQRLTMMRELMAKEGMNDLKFDLAEVGNPTLNGNTHPASDQQLTECYIPQITSLAIASGMMDRMYYYSLLDRNDGYSLTGIDGGRLVIKPSYYSFITMAKLLSRLSKIAWYETGETVRVEGNRTDGIDFTVVWSRVADRDVAYQLPPGRTVFDAQGYEVKETSPQQVTLHPKNHEYLAGPARILVSRRA